MLSSSWLMLSTSLCSRIRAPMYLSTALAVLGETFFGFALFTALFTSDDLRIAIAVEAQRRLRPLNGSEIFPPALAPSLCTSNEQATRRPAYSPRVGFDQQPRYIQRRQFCRSSTDDNHLLRRIDQLLDLESVRSELKPFYSTIGRPSVAPELMIRMLVIGY